MTFISLIVFSKTEEMYMSSIPSNSNSALHRWCANIYSFFIIFKKKNNLYGMELGTSMSKENYREIQKITLMNLPT